MTEDDWLATLIQQSRQKVINRKLIMHLFDLSITSAKLKIFIFKNNRVEEYSFYNHFLIHLIIHLSFISKISYNMNYSLIK